ncbi:hypothetical protein D3C81_1708580 [compost metagenome]
MRLVSGLNPNPVGEPGADNFKQCRVRGRYRVLATVHFGDRRDVAGKGHEAGRVEHLETDIDGIRAAFLGVALSSCNESTDAFTRRADL